MASSQQILHEVKELKTSDEDMMIQKQISEAVERVNATRPDVLELVRQTVKDNIEAIIFAIDHRKDTVDVTVPSQLDAVYQFVKPRTGNGLTMIDRYLADVHPSILGLSLVGLSGNKEGKYVLRLNNPMAIWR